MTQTTKETASQDIVERLRERAHTFDEYAWHSDIELEAADEIEKLREDRNRLREALRNAYSDAIDAVNKIKNDPFTELGKHQKIYGTETLTAKSFMVAVAEDIEKEIKARAALKEDE